MPFMPLPEQRFGLFCPDFIPCKNAILCEGKGIMAFPYLIQRYTLMLSFGTVCLTEIKASVVY